MCVNVLNVCNRDFMVTNPQRITLSNYSTSNRYEACIFRYLSQYNLCIFVHNNLKCLELVIPHSGSNLKYYKLQYVFKPLKFS